MDEAENIKTDSVNLADGVTGAVRGPTSRTAFTPGPWRVPFFHGTEEHNAEARALGLEPVPAVDNNGARFIMAESGRVALVDCQTQFRRGHGHQTACAERDANARLIAAAPELLVALRTYVAYDEYINGPLGDTSTNRLQVARAAIAKAEGQA